MGSTSFLLFLSSFLLFSLAAQAFNITRLLGQFPEFSTFNSFLTQTNVSIGINRRQTITVLAVENGAVSSLSSKSVEDLKNIMRLHVILDYYDLAKLNNLEKGTALLTTLYQASGQATGQQGFLNVTAMDTGEIEFGSAVKGSPLNAKLVKKVAAQPFNISVLQISTPIMATGVGGPPVSPSPVSPPPAPAPGAPKAAPPSPAPAAESPKAGEAPAPSEAPAADGPAADAPTADAPADAPAADGPATDGPASSPPMPADGPVADTTQTADAPSKASGAAEVGLGSCIAVASGLAATLLAL